MLLASPVRNSNRMNKGSKVKEGRFLIEAMFCPRNFEKWVLMISEEKIGKLRDRLYGLRRIEVTCSPNRVHFQRFSVKSLMSFNELSN